MYHTILVPLDGSDLAEHVLPHVCALAASSGASIVLLRVPAEPIYDYLPPDPQLASELRRDVETGAQVYLDEVAARLAELGLSVTTKVAGGGPIHEAILDVAREHGVDLIAMSTHGRSGIARMVIGSVADQVVRHSPMPVLLIRPDPPRVAPAWAARQRAAVERNNWN